MKTKYKGYEIWASREKCLAGYDLTYFTIVRLSDGLIIEDSFTSAEDPVNYLVNEMKNRVDEFIKTKGQSELLADSY